MSTKLSPPPFGQVNEASKNFESTHDVAFFLTAFETAVDHRIERQQLLSILDSYLGRQRRLWMTFRTCFDGQSGSNSRKKEPVVTLPNTASITD